MEEEDDATAVRKRKREGEAFGAGVVKELVQAEEEDECEAGIDEEAVEEVMRWLEKEIYSSGDKEDEEKGFVTINGNEESCGPSFSAAASTVMAAVDTRAGAPPPPTPIPWPWPETAAAAAARVDDDERAAAELSADGYYQEEEWLVELLAGDPALELWSLE
ncbi:hypothetical protein BRADI_2g05920v3 [Brachypodium distachyon]|uniref:Uncharacterized protein n=1 Tax=Brachypodium distachyon TaxID=15368 RepID=I1HCY5_BRADI|nr:hypothetical protein BRADI_2g05920v3 [Brachypodium distachyon]